MGPEGESLPLSAWDEHLRNCWQKGEPCTIGRGDLPPAGGKDVISAQQIAELLGSTPGHEPLVLRGAVICGPLTLTDLQSPRALHLEHCRFDTAPDLRGAKFAALTLRRCSLPGLLGDRLAVLGDTQLTGCDFTGPCTLDYAQLGTALDLSYSHFRAAAQQGTDASALSLLGATVALSLTAQRINVTGFCDLMSLQVGGQLMLDGASFDSGSEGTARTALRLQRARIGDALFWRRVSVKRGRVLFTYAQTEVLLDDAESWTACGAGLDLDGFRYTSIPASHLGDLSDRIAWLEQGTTGDEAFCGQPWRHFATVLREGGDDAAARQVMFARERLYIRHERARMRGRIRAHWSGKKGAKRSLGQGLRGKIAAISALPGYGIHGIWSLMKRLVIGYGYDPKRPLFWSVGLICLGWALAAFGWQLGVFTPLSPQILVSEDWLAAMQVNAAHPTAHWLTSDSAQHYESFSAFLFALDTYLPVMDLGQEKAWGLTTGTASGWWGRTFWVLLQAAGWVVTSLGIAGVAGLVQKGRND